MRSILAVVVALFAITALISPVAASESLVSESVTEALLAPILAPEAYLVAASPSLVGSNTEAAALWADPGLAYTFATARAGSVTTLETLSWSAAATLALTSLTIAGLAYMTDTRRLKHIIRREDIRRASITSTTETRSTFGAGIIAAG